MDNTEIEELFDKTVLILDDDLDIVEALADILENNGFHTLIETDPWRALKIVKNKPVGLIISDYKMPGVSGDEFYRMIRVLNDKPRFIFVTGFADAFPSDLKNEEGLTVLEKPFTVAQIEKTLGKLNLLPQKKSA